jgi:hypothetical protein
LNEADDEYRKLGWQYQFVCGHKSKSLEIELHGLLTQLAYPIRTIGESALCEVCYKLQKIKRLSIWEIENSPEIT